MAGGGDRPSTDPCWRSLSSIRLSAPPPHPRGCTAKASQTVSWDSFHSGLSILSCGEQSIMQSLHMVVFGEYVQALATHLRMLAPRKWGSLKIQVETDIWKLDNIFRKHGVSRGPLG